MNRGSTIAAGSEFCGRGPCLGERRVDSWGAAGRRGARGPGEWRAQVCPPSTDGRRRGRGRDDSRRRRGVRCAWRSRGRSPLAVYCARRGVQRCERGARLYPSEVAGRCKAGFRVCSSPCQPRLGSAHAPGISASQLRLELRSSLGVGRSGLFPDMAAHHGLLVLAVGAREAHQGGVRDLLGEAPRGPVVARARSRATPGGGATSLFVGAQLRGWSLPSEAGRASSALSRARRGQPLVRSLGGQAAAASPSASITDPSEVPYSTTLAP